MKLKRTIMLPIEGAFELLFPNTCNACLEIEAPHGEIMCIACQAKSSISELHQHRENEFTRHFWGRVPIYTGAAMYRFSKGGIAQNLVSQLKYKGNIAIGTYLGKQYGNVLKTQILYKQIDMIIPVPLHFRKEGKRGFNQSEVFGSALAESMGKPCETKVLLRVKHTATQTKKSRQERLDNLTDAFHLKDGFKIEGKHILLVDDVLTTGATLEACVLALQSENSVTVSLLTIGIGDSI